MQIPQITPKTLNYLFWIALAGFILSVIVNISTYFGLEILYNRLFIALLGTGASIGVWGSIVVWIVLFFFLRRMPRLNFWRAFWSYAPIWMKLGLLASVLYFYIGGLASLYSYAPAFGNLVQQDNKCLIQNGGTIVRELNPQECQQRIVDDARVNSIGDIGFYSIFVVLLYCKRIEANKPLVSQP